MRVVAAAVVGALCAAAWVASVEPVGRVTVCEINDPLACGFGMILIVAPVLGVVWALVAWGLLKLARFSPAWPTALLGFFSTVAVMVCIGLVMIGMHAQPVKLHGHIALAAGTAAGYALAAAVTARYRGRRDRTEHHGQDG